MCEQIMLRCIITFFIHPATQGRRLPAGTPSPNLGPAPIPCQAAFMFQSFDAVTDPDQGVARIASLRKWMAANGLDGVLVPRADEHQGEYVAPRAERLQWL